ncbi:LysR substrate-binding domain-containing protein [Paraburkholderia sp. CNPSo 3274]|uniref:LysR substrate-binding domain-containing protein n=1 Tax=Paraburkholderia sp. CNPSo 3274 TaxID=2940932 RepID=UPI0020B8000D|nr:LysR substrate-binding domain-containing protein [Paraburkholderia sp. CNPSo 3274]MCP3711370.1 LysR substrate-binding domain-containing protein [Paraburkholderia sp. CNPSo 3274]
MLDLRRLRYFVTVAEELHFGRAAVRLNIAQPPLTRHIAALEAELGIRLFERSTRAVKLTPEGILFLERARGVLHAVGEAQATARKLAQGVTGRIAIGYTSSIPMSDAFAEIVRNAGRALPEVELTFREVATASQHRQIVEGALDIGFGWSAANAQEDSLSSLVIAHEPLIAAVPSGSVHARKQSIDFAELRDETFLIFPPGSGSALTAALDSLCAQAGMEPRIGPTASQTAALISLVAAERGVAIVPAFTMALQRSGVAYVPLRGAPALDQTVSWTEPFTSTCVERFVELAQSVAQRETRGF